jgi:hypothetical protein
LIIYDSYAVNATILIGIYCGVYATNKTGSSSDDWIY